MESVQKHQQKISTILLLVVVFLAGYLVGGVNTTISEAQGGPYAIGSVDEAFEPLFEMYQIIEARYIGTDDLDVQTLVDGAITGMVDSLGDPYSSYMDADTYTRFLEGFEGEFEGIGVVIMTNDGDEIEVIQVIRGTGAEAAGVRPGDIFVDVNGQNIEDVPQNELVNLVRGPAGTQVTITFRRGEDLVTLTITRSRFQSPTVDSELLDNDIAYISLFQFDQPALGQLQAAIEELDINSRAGLIFDLRDNPGGLLSVGIDVASLFIEDGPVLYQAYSNGDEDIYYANGGENGDEDDDIFANITVPIVVLVNENSASASEFVAGAIQDTNTAILIGETTFGKATVQTLFNLNSGGGARITTARYLIPSRRWLHEIGLEPDIIVELDEEAFDFNVSREDDVQLQAAIDYILNGGE
jgi:carboxyl-terminal processing protease